MSEHRKCSMMQAKLRIPRVYDENYKYIYGTEKLAVSRLLFTSFSSLLAPFSHSYSAITIFAEN